MVHTVSTGLLKVFDWSSFNYEGGGLISLWLYQENKKLRNWQNLFTLHILLWIAHTYDFVVLTSLTHPRKFWGVLLQIRI
jgi:hypothetical protein